MAKLVATATARKAMILLLSAGLASLSCRRHNDAAALFPVRGTIIFRGRPASGILVVLHAKDNETSTARSYGKSDGSGAFQITTYELNDGAPAGEYAITLVWPPKESEEAPGLTDKLGGRYSDPARSPLRFHVAARPNTMPTIDLK